MNLLAVQVRATALLGGEQLVARGIIDDSGDALAPMLQRHRHAEHREAMGKVGGAVERVDVPAVFASRIYESLLFAEDVVRGPEIANTVANQGLGFPVGLSDQIGFAFVFY